MAKRISSDKEHIDYMGTKWGVRVRNGVCRPLALTAEGKWEEYDDFYSIPVSPSAIELPSSGEAAWISALTVCLGHYEGYTRGELNEDKSELRLLILGSTSFDSAISPR